MVGHVFDVQDVKENLSKYHAIPLIHSLGCVMYSFLCAESIIVTSALLVVNWVVVYMRLPKVLQRVLLVSQAVWQVALLK